jgi:calcineurin-like phosphoesterase family protein
MGKIFQIQYGFRMIDKKYFFTSDTHFGHSNIIKYSNRPFNHVDDMDQHLIQQINQYVGPDDVLWHLGDFSMYSHSKNRDNRYYDQCKRYRDQIKCRNVNIVWGNHDDTSIRDLFNEACFLKELRVTKDQMFVLCHYAMAIWNKSHRGAIHLYGHSHSMAEPWLDKNMPGRRSIDVGVDYAFKVLKSYRPWSFKELMNHFSNKKGFWFDHHAPKDQPEQL